MSEKKYPQIEGHPSQMNRERAEEVGRDKAIMVGYDGIVDYCMFIHNEGIGDYWWTVDLYTWKPEKIFCHPDAAEAYRGLTGFDY